MKPIALSRMLRLVALTSSIKNRLFNAVASVLCGHRVAIDWRNLKIFHPTRITIGRNFAAGHSLWLESVDGKGKLVIGNDVNVSDSVHIGCAMSIQIGDGVLIGSKVLITDHAHGRTTDLLLDLPPNQRDIHCKGPVSIGRAVWLGDGACILSGVTIGDCSIIGANSVVTRNIPPRTVWAGVPARQVWPTKSVPEADAPHMARLEGTSESISS